MNIRQLFLLLLFCLLGLNTLSGNNLASPEEANTLSSYTESIDNQDVVILNEENNIIFSGESSLYIVYTVNKKVQFKVFSQAGIDKIKRFVLPESLDPTYIAHFPKARNYTNAFSRMVVDDFQAEIKKEDGSVKEAEFTPEIEEIKMYLLDEGFYGTYEKFVYSIKNLEIGDELTVNYSYHLLYTENSLELSGFRIFFHSDIPKLKYKLSIQHHSELVVEYDYMNNADPDTLIDVDKIKTYYWTRENLPGCISEKGSKAYLSLPYIVVKPWPYDLLYVVPHTEERRLTPIYSIFANVRESLHFGISISVLQGVKTRQFQQIENFIASQTQGIENDTIGIEKLKKIHNTIVDEFEFADDIDYFTREDRRDPRMGEYLSAYRIRDIARNEIYLALIRKLGLKYFTTYLCDNRSGVITDNFLAPMHQSDLLYTIMLDDGNIVFLYPKKARFGWYIDEIPFYFERSRARLVHLNDYRNTEEAINEEFREIYLPQSTMANNTRSSRVMVNANLDDLTTNFTASVSLSGQFSTMTRGAYLYDYQDETANELYGKKIWEINDKVKLVDKQVDVKKKEYPFNTTIKASYQADNLLSIDKDTVKLDLSGWFKHIIYEDFDISNRQLDFYPDFANRDTYSYFIQFDKDVNLLQGIENVQINNEMATFIINIEQVDSKSIKIESSFAISNKVEVDNIKIIKDIYDRIEELNSGKVKLIISSN